MSEFSYTWNTVDGLRPVTSVSWWHYSAKLEPVGTTSQDFRWVWSWRFDV